MCGRATLWMFLLFAANAHKFLWVSGAVDEDEVMHKLNQMETDQYMLVLNIKSLISQILTANNQIAYRLDKLETKSTNDKTESNFERLNKQMSGMAGKLGGVEKTLGSVKTQVQENAKAIKLPDCQRWLKWLGVSKTNLFSTDEKHFYFNKTELNWYKAREWCTERGMQMATLKTLTQVEAVYNELYKRLGTHYGFWLSGSDSGRQAGKFHWADGTPVDNSTWDKGQPDNFGAGKETCISLNTAYTKLTDWPCLKVSRILCEVPTALSSCVS